MIEIPLTSAEKILDMLEANDPDDKVWGVMNEMEPQLTMDINDYVSLSQEDAQIIYEMLLAVVESDEEIHPVDLAAFNDLEELVI